MIVVGEVVGLRKLEILFYVFSSFALRVFDTSRIFMDLLVN